VNISFFCLVGSLRFAVVLDHPLCFSRSSMLIVTTRINYDVTTLQASALIPDIPGLKETPHLTNMNIFNLTELPATMTVIGAGPIGMELAQVSQTHLVLFLIPLKLTLDTRSNTCSNPT
jgi:hypothetical protein